MNFKTAALPASGTPGLRQILTRMDTRNEDAAVDLYLRVALAALGLGASAVCLVAVPGADRFFTAAVFLVFPVLPAVAGIWVDFLDARRDLTTQEVAV